MLVTLIPTSLVRGIYVNDGSGGGEPAADMTQNFSTYANAAAIKADTTTLGGTAGKWINGAGSNFDAQTTLNTSEGYGASDRHMVYNFPDQSGVSGYPCNAPAADYGNMSPGFLYLGAGHTEVAIEYVVRFEHFIVNVGGACGAEYKLCAMGDLANGIGRWNFAEMQENQWNGGWPGDEAHLLGVSPLPTTLFNDGVQHVFRIHAKLSPSGAAGISKFWIDGVLVKSESGFNTSASHAVIDCVALGLNLNQGPNVSNMKLHWYQVKAWWTSLPSWA